MTKNKGINGAQLRTAREKTNLRLLTTDANILILYCTVRIPILILAKKRDREVSVQRVRYTAVQGKSKGTNI